MTAGRTSWAERRRRWLVWVLVVTWAGALTATHLPKGNVPETHVSDKTLHVVGYAVLAALFLATLAACGVGRTRRLLIVLVVLAVYGALDEITQPIVGRHASAWDWLADVSGIALAGALLEPGTALLKRCFTVRRSAAQ